MKTKVIRSPLFYVGDKYKLLEQIKKLFPENINNYYEPFVGGGTVFLNVKAQKYYLNDIDKNLINIHDYLVKSSKSPKQFFKIIEEIVHKYNLSRSYKEDVIPGSLKKKWKKTYFARYNKKGYEKLREFANKDSKVNPLFLYVLLIYGFNRMLRFNNAGRFNLPVGNVDFNKNVVDALKNYFDFVKDKKIYFTSQDFRRFLVKRVYEKDDFVYFDPPYLITASEYNKLWDESTEIEILNLIDELDGKNIKFALSNVTHYNGYKNDLLIKWMKKYKATNIESNYINYHNNKKKEIKEVLITNY